MMSSLDEGLNHLPDIEKGVVVLDVQNLPQGALVAVHHQLQGVALEQIDDGVIVTQSDLFKGLVLVAEACIGPVSIDTFKRVRDHMDFTVSLQGLPPYVSREVLHVPFRARGESLNASLPYVPKKKAGWLRSKSRCRGRRRDNDRYRAKKMRGRKTR